jgi:Raf kinase inhibitor-like YbhB/YbcL family protein
MHITSQAFKDNGVIPRQYTCDSTDSQVPLRWSGVPSGTRELVLVIRDPDAKRGPFVHWAVAGIPPTASEIPESAIEGRNSFGSLGYRGPCPPKGDRPHHYVITLDALRTPSGLKTGFSADQLRTPTSAIATLTGTYARR